MMPPDEFPAGDDSEDAPDGAIVGKFIVNGSVPDEVVPVATLAVLWYVDEDGQDAYISKFDGKQRTSTTVGDLMALTHEYLHASRDD